MWSRISPTHRCLGMTTFREAFSCLVLIDGIPAGHFCLGFDALKGESTDQLVDGHPFVHQVSPNQGIRSQVSAWSIKSSPAPGQIKSPHTCTMIESSGNTALWQTYLNQTKFSCLSKCCANNVTLRVTLQEQGSSCGIRSLDCLWDTLLEPPMVHLRTR